MYNEWLRLFVFETDFLGYDRYDFQLRGTNINELIINTNNKWKINEKMEWKYFKDNIKIDGVKPTKISYDKFLIELNSLVNKINNNIYFYRTNPANCGSAKYDKSLIQKLIDIDLRNITYNLYIYKGECTVTFSDKFNYLNEKEKIDVILSLTSLWMQVVGENWIEFCDFQGFIFVIENNNELHCRELFGRRIYFDIKYLMKETFKTYAGKWDDERKKWYIYDCAKNKKNIIIYNF